MLLPNTAAALQVCIFTKWPNATLILTVIAVCSENNKQPISFIIVEAKGKKCFTFYF